MQVIYGLENFCRPAKGISLTVGNFDGVHVGHQAILRKVVKLAKENDLKPAVMTFEFHPAKLLHPDLVPGTLMAMEQRIAIMEQIGIELVIVAKCKKSFFEETREQFVENVLVKSFDLKYIVEGSNFRFGCDRSGNIDYLIEVGPKFGFEAIKIQPIRVDLGGRRGKPISSSLIRKFVSQGKVDLARQGLGRCYTLVGQVIGGAKRGRTIGFPTANLNVGEQLLPHFGIYASEVQIDDKFWPSAAIIGPAPTFEQYQTAIEAFVIDYEGDLYGKTLQIHLYKYLRDIIKFDDSDQLVVQIDKDVTAIRQILKNIKTKDTI